MSAGNAPFSAGEVLIATLTALAVLSACGTSDMAAPYGECPKPATYPGGGTFGSVVPGGPVIYGAGAPVLYGTAAPWFTGPLQPAPASVSQAAGQALYVCP